ncbi:hypothetical protein Hanom_Chr17g01553391 [Helianthus anomalus]
MAALTTVSMLISRHVIINMTAKGTTSSTHDHLSLLSVAIFFFHRRYYLVT